MEERSVSSGSPYYFLPTIVLSAAIGTLLIIYLNQRYGTEGVEGFSALTTMLLSLALVILYLQQSKIQRYQGDLQRKQTTIVTEQQKIREAEIQPHLEIEKINNNQTDEIGIKLTNYGNGIGTDLQLVAEIYCQNRGETLSRPTPAKLDREALDSERGGNAIKSEEEQAYYEVDARLARPQGVGGCFGDILTEILEESNNNIGKIQVNLHVNYTNLLGETKNVPVFGENKCLEVDTSHLSEKTLGEVLDQGNKRSIISGGFKYPDNI